jgi:hypothetical protein
MHQYSFGIFILEYYRYIQLVTVEDYISAVARSYIETHCPISLDVIF